MLCWQGVGRERSGGKKSAGRGGWHREKTINLVFDAKACCAGKESAGKGGGTATKPVHKLRKKPVQKPGFGPTAPPLGGVSVLAAVEGPSPGEGGGKNSKKNEKT